MYFLANIFNWTFSNQIELHIQREDVSGNDKVVIMVTACLRWVSVALTINWSVDYFPETNQHTLRAGKLFTLPYFICHKCL